MIDQRQAEITPNTPLRLADAVKIAFLMGGMTVAGLRRERDRNRLVVEKIAGKEFTTLAHIERIRELCRDEAREPDFSLRPPAETRAEISPTEQPGSSGTRPLSINSLPNPSSVRRKKLLSSVISIAYCHF